MCGHRLTIPLFDTLLSTIKPPEGDPEAPFRICWCPNQSDYNDFVGRIGIGRIQNGVAKVARRQDWHNPDLKMRGRLTVVRPRPSL